MSAPSAPDFAVSHEFALPPERLFKLWTQTDHLRKWWGPQGFKVTTCTLDLWEGGALHYCLMSPQQQEMWGKFTYREIKAPRRLVFISSFSNRAGAITRHPLSATWPLETLTSIDFEPVGDSRTRLDIRAVPINTTPEEDSTFASAMASLNMGWRGTFAQLESYIASL